MALADVTDAEVLVIDAIRARDHYAFEELVRRNDRWVRGVVFGVLGRQDRVEDVVQQVWAAVWARIGELRDPRWWRSWLYRLARNAAVDAGREIGRRKKHAQRLAEESVSRPAVPRADQALAGNELHGEVLQAIQALPAMYREPFVLRHLNDWSYREIAEVMNMPVDTVETRLVRARRLLRESLKDKVG